MPDFTLDPRLEHESLAIGDLALAHVRLVNDSRFPWLLLVPRRADVSELTDLDDADAATLMSEVRVAVRVMGRLASPDKVNVAALGNMVPQLHVHVIGRYLSDPAWPGAVWGSGPATPYPDHAAVQLAERAGALFAAA